MKIFFEVSNFHGFFFYILEVSGNDKYQVFCGLLFAFTFEVALVI